MFKGDRPKFFGEAYYKPRRGRRIAKYAVYWPSDIEDTYDDDYTEADDAVGDVTMNCPRDFWPKTPTKHITYATTRRLAILLPCYM